MENDAKFVSVPNDILEDAGAAPSDPLYAPFEAIAGHLVALSDAIRGVVKDLSDEDVLRLADLCDEEGRPGEDPFGRGICKNFPMPEWAEVAKTLRAEVGARRMHRDAVSYMGKTGASYYCPRCRGECTPEHLAELRDS